MAQAFRIPHALFDERAMRDLRIDDTRRSLVAISKAHGRQPNQHDKYVVNKFCTNFVLRGRGRFVEASGKTHELSPV